MVAIDHGIGNALSNRIYSSQAVPLYPRVSATCGSGGPAASLPWAIITSESSAATPDYIGARAGDFAPLAVLPALRAACVGCACACE